MYNSKMDSKNQHTVRGRLISQWSSAWTTPKLRSCSVARRWEPEQWRRKNGAQVLSWRPKSFPKSHRCESALKAEDAGVCHPQMMAAAMGTVTRGVTSTLLLALSFSSFRLSESLTYLDGTTHILGKPFPLTYCPICQPSHKIPPKNTPRVLCEYLRQFSN